ncbi:phage head spike fiber domain-containing protein [Silvania hatchlandensis]|uniref:LamG domain-containing protein n=1 Tax=Silvania hatchlandensis TaxID=2926469 RepID=A0A9J6Q4T4_9ENTR|nr:hypothetical protein [Silvania hatchlandensis]MCU6666073.1 LamG domain-containing protein [Silvania hatchlandensis]
MATITDDLAKAVTEGFRQAQIDVVNQDLILSGTGDVTVTLADGSKKTGPSWTKLIAAATAAGTSAAAAKTSETNAASSATSANSSKNAAADSATAADTSKTNAKTSETNAKTSETNAKTSETNAKTSETNAAASLAAAQLLTTVPYEEAPYPDVWAPLNDDLRLLAGFAPYDTLTISGQVLELPTKSATFTRSTTATYIDKSGVLRTAAINEPRFERDGLLIEGQSTNYILNSEDPAKWNSNGTLTKESIIDGTTQAVTFKGTVNAATSSNHQATASAGITVAIGDVVVLSARVKATSYRIRFRFTLDGAQIADSFFDGNTGGYMSATAGLTYTSSLGSDGYVYVSVTYTAASAGVVTGGIWLNSGTNLPIGAIICVQTAQCEKNAVATSYIPTGAAATTRASEQLTLQPQGNIGYRNVGDDFARTIALEFTVDKFVQPTTGVAYVDFLANMGARNDIIIRGVSSQLISYRGSGGIAIQNVTYPFNKKTYVQTVDVANNNTVTGYFDGKVATRNANIPTGPTSAGTAIIFNGNSFAVYHIRNFRIWHRVLTPNQINGLR